MTAPSSSEKEPRCFICGESAPLRCASCKRVSYCGKECQIAHWKLAHKRECKHFTKARMDAPTDGASAREALCSLQDRVSSMNIREAIAEMRRAQAEVDRLKKTKNELCQAVQRAKDGTEDAQGAAELARNIAMLAGQQPFSSNHDHTAPTTPMASNSGGRHTGSSHGGDQAEGVKRGEEAAQPTYAQCEYWEARYRSEARGTYEWYVGYDELKDLCHTHIAREDPVLEIGCGMSCLSEAMVADGYRVVTAIDVSRAVVKQMQARTAAQPRSASMPVHCVRYVCMDAPHMPDMHDRSFGAVVDKGTLDAVASQDAQKARQIFAEVMRVLREGGRAILISTMTLEVLHALLTPPLLEEHTVQDIVTLNTSYDEDVRAFVVRKGLIPKADAAWGAIQGFLDTARAAVESGSLQALIDNDDYKEVDTPPDDRRVSLTILSVSDNGVNVAYSLEDGESWRHSDYVGMYAEGETNLLGGYRDFVFVDEGAVEGSVMLRGDTRGAVVMAVSKAGSVLGTARVVDVQRESSPHADGAGVGSEAVSGAMGEEYEHEGEEEEGEEGEDAHVAMELQSMIGCWRVMAWAPSQTTHTTKASSITHARVGPLVDRRKGSDAKRDAYRCSAARRGVHVSFKQGDRLWRVDVTWPLTDGDRGGADEEGWTARYQGVELETMDDHVSLRLPATPTREYDVAAAIDAAPARLAVRVDQMCSSVSQEVGGPHEVHLTCRFCECRITSAIHRALPLPSDRLDDVSEFLLCFADSALPLTTQHIHSRPGLLLIGEGFVLLHGSSVACSSEGATERSDEKDVISCPRCDTALGARVKTEEGERHDDVRLWLHRLGVERQLPQISEESVAEDVLDGHTVMTRVSSILRAACKRSKKRRFRILPESSSAACRMDLKVWGQEVLYCTAGDTSAEPRAGMKVAYRVDYGEQLKVNKEAEGRSAMGSRNGCGGSEKGDGGRVCGRRGDGHNHSHLTDGGACGNGTCHGGSGSGGNDHLELLLPFDEWHAVAALLESSSSSVPPSCHLPFAPHRVAYLPLVPPSGHTQPA